MTTSQYPSWFSELVAISAAAPELSELTGFTVAFVVEGRTYGLDLARGVPTDGSVADCKLLATDELFNRLVQGATTLQSAYRSKELGLKGDPQSLLRLAYLFDRT